MSVAGPCESSVCVYMNCFFKVSAFNWLLYESVNRSSTSEMLLCAPMTYVYTESTFIFILLQVNKKFLKLHDSVRSRDV